jgi:hypothetical protein
MVERVHLIVERGADSGLRITVSPNGTRVGRAPKNDVVLNDPLLSRHHCRFLVPPGQGLWVNDLGSANQTLVNDQPVQDAQLHTGDRVTMGDTMLRVVNDESGSAAADAPAPSLASVIDLGLQSQQPKAGRPRSNRVLLIGLLIVVTACAILIWAAKLLNKATQPQRLPPSAGEQEPDLEISYEKVLANTNSIFRYDFRLARDGTLSIRVDDTGSTHVGESKPVSRDLIRDLTTFIQGSGWLGLNPEYAGTEKDVLEQSDICVTIGRQVYRTRVANWAEPTAFKTVREKLENFGYVELCLGGDIQYPPEKLVELARDACQVGRQMYDEREIAYGNLAAAIKSFAEADFYLRTVDPKPDFYPDVLSGTSESREELEKRYHEHSFLVERANRRKAWEEAARELRILCELIPDRSDPRNQQAQKKLLEVENRLKRR